MKDQKNHYFQYYLRDNMRILKILTTYVISKTDCQNTWKCIYFGRH